MGCNVEFTDGVNVGYIVRFAVGTRVGYQVVGEWVPLGGSGEGVEISVGASVGYLVALEVGATVGCIVTLSVGVNVGICVGIAVGEFVIRMVGAAVCSRHIMLRSLHQPPLRSVRWTTNEVPACVT